MSMSVLGIGTGTLAVIKLSSVTLQYFHRLRPHDSGGDSDTSFLQFLDPICGAGTFVKSDGLRVFRARAANDRSDTGPY